MLSRKLRGGTMNASSCIQLCIPMRDREILTSLPFSSISASIHPFFMKNCTDDIDEHSLISRFFELVF